MSAVAPVASNKYARLFGIVVLIGVVVNLGAAMPGIIIPEIILGLLGLEPEVTEFWTRFAAWLLILLSLMYIPAGLQPFRSPAHSWLTVACRWGGVFFISAVTLILGLNWCYFIFVLLDLIFAAPQLILLTLAVRDQRRRTEDEGQ